MPPFVVNPLSLCISQPNFEAWLKDKGFLEVLEKCTLDNAILAGQGSFTAFCSLLRTNPLESLTFEDFRKEPVAWTDEFFDCGQGPSQTFSWPISVTQARFRMEENLKRYTGNYLVLVLVVFVCFLYKMPLAVLGILCLFGLWDVLMILNSKLKLQRRSFRFRVLITVGNFGTMFIAVYFKLALAVFWAGVASFIVVAVHSSLRKITPRNH